MAEDPIHYDFVPYKFGAYSFQLEEDLSILQRDGYVSISVDSKRRQIKALGKYDQKPSFVICPERGDDLIRKTYQKYPYFTINSEILGRIFNKAESEQYLIERQSYINENQVLFTIGYEGKSIESFVNTLIRNGIRKLCDVRKNPLSRKFGFSKGKLQHIMETVNIEYEHLPELGIKSDKRTFLEMPEDYEALFEEYAKMMPKLESELEKLYAFFNFNKRIALMCYELEPKMCHRHVIKDWLVSKFLIKGKDL